MFVLNDDLSIYATRGDIVFFTVTAEDKGKTYTFKAGDVVRIKVYDKKNAKSVVLEKDFPVTADAESVEILLTGEETKFGDVISKPKDYWYEVELNPMSNPQTIIGYDEDGAKVFKLFPEGKDLEEYIPDAEDIPFVDTELDLTSPRPVQNQAVTRAVVHLRAAFETLNAASVNMANTMELENASTDEEIAVERARINNIVKGNTPDGAEVTDIRIGFDGKTYATAGEAVRGQIKTLARGRFALATLIPSGNGSYPSISTTDKTFTMGGDTLIISDRLPLGYVSLLESKGNHTVTWGDEITSTAICFYYNIATDKLVATNYSARVVDYNYILLATLRTGWGKIKSQAICSCPLPLSFSKIRFPSSIFLDSYKDSPNV